MRGKSQHCVRGRLSVADARRRSVVLPVVRVSTSANDRGPDLNQDGVDFNRKSTLGAATIVS